MPIRSFIGSVVFSCLAVSARAEGTVEFQPVVTGLSAPLFVTHGGDGSGRLFVVEQGGRIQIVKNGELLASPFLDISDQVVVDNESGLLGLAFHPGFADNGRFFVDYVTAADTPSGMKTVVAEYRVSDEDPDRADSEERVILEIDQPTRMHNAGMLAFGPEGLLYIASGDGGAGLNGQDPSTLLGAILRIDIDHGEPYAIPSSNPFVDDPERRPEIYAYGFRNPWRFSIDRGTGRLFVGDVGHTLWEEIDLVQRGGNYGWALLEGEHCYPAGRDFQSEVLLINSNQEDVSGRIVFHGRDGGPASVSFPEGATSEVDFELPAGKSRSFLTGGTSDPFYVGWVEVLADRPVSALLVFQLSSENGDSLAEAGIAGSETSRSWAIRVSGDQGTGLGAGLAVANPGGAEIEIVISVTDDDDQVLLQTSRTLEAGTQQAFFMEDLGELPQSYAATVQIEASDPVAATLLRTRHRVHSASLPLAR